MSNQRKKVIVLTDQRTGNNNQSFVVAKALEPSYCKIEVEYSKLTFLPNIFLQYFPLHISKDTIEKIKSIQVDIIISCGRRLGLLALYIKKFLLPGVKLVQIIHPPADYKLFDIIITPYHDNFNSQYSNHIEIIGALSNTLLSKTEEVKLKKDFIGVLIGGTMKNYSFSPKTTLDLCSHIKRIYHSQQLPIVISFSRRTSVETIRIMKKEIDFPCQFFDPNKPEGTNPYNEIVIHAKAIIVTGDSVSMCSEVLSQGKPLYIYWPINLSNTRLRRFISQIIEKKLAIELTKDIKAIKEYKYTPLNEIQKILPYIKMKLDIV